MLCVVPPLNDYHIRCFLPLICVHSKMKKFQSFKKVSNNNVIKHDWFSQYVGIFCKRYLIMTVSWQCWTMLMLYLTFQITSISSSVIVQNIVWEGDKRFASRRTRVDKIPLVGAWKKETVLLQVHLCIVHHLANDLKYKFPQLLFVKMRGWKGSSYEKQPDCELFSADRSVTTKKSVWVHSWRQRELSRARLSELNAQSEAWNGKDLYN